MTTAVENLTGRALDIAVARRVFGYDVEERTTPIRGDEWYIVEVSRDTGRRCYRRVPDYRGYWTVSLHLVFHIAAHLRETRGAHLMLEQHRYDDAVDVGENIRVKAGQWSAHFQDSALLGTGIGDTASEAVCRAALAAVGA